MGQNLAASAALSSIITPMISSFCWRTSPRRRSMYGCTFFFWLSASEGVAALLVVFWVVVCARPEGGEPSTRTKTVALNMRINVFISIILSLNFSTTNFAYPGISAASEESDEESLGCGHPYVVGGQNFGVVDFRLDIDALEASFFLGSRQEDQVILIVESLL